MALKNGSYEKFKAIQMNNEEIAQQEFAGMRRSPEGWHLSSSTSNSILGGKPLLKAGGTGAKILDIASTEPKPQTAGQAVLKAAGMWKALNQHYANGGTIGSLPESTKNTIADLTAQKRAQAEAAQVTDQRAQPQTTPGVSSVEMAAIAGTPSAAKTYTVNGKQMTLGEYIKALGTDPSAVYRQNVAAANAAYDRQRATYGAEAEALAGQGLTHSGTSDHLDAQAYAAKQKAISQAAASRDQQMTEIAGQHMTYLQQEKGAQDAKIQTALERATAMQLNTANTVKYLMAMTGMTKSEAERYAEGNAALIAEEDNPTATAQEITQTYLALVKPTKDGGMGMSSEAARQYLKSGTYNYDGALVDQAVNDLVGAQELAKADQTAQAQKAVSDVFDKAISVWDGATAQTKLAELGITVTPDEEDGIVSLADMRDAITYAYNNHLIAEDQYLTLQKQLADVQLKGEIEDNNLYGMLKTASEFSIDRNIYDHAIGKIANELTILSNTPALLGNKKSMNINLSVKLKSGDKGNFVIPAHKTDAKNKSKVRNGFIEQNSKSYYVAGDGTMFEISGKLNDEEKAIVSAMCRKSEK